MARWSLNPVTHSQTTKSIPWTLQLHSTPTCKYKTALLPHVSPPVPGTLYIRAWMEANSRMSIHSSKPRWQTFRVRVWKLQLQACLGPVTAGQAEWRACQKADLWKRLLIRGEQQSDSLRNRPPVNIQIPNEQKMREKSHCGKSFLCIFTLVRGENSHKRRMEMRMKRHERHILQRFMKKRKKAAIVIIFPNVFFSFWDFVNSSLVCLRLCSSTAVSSPSVQLFRRTHAHLHTSKVFILFYDKMKWMHELWAKKGVNICFAELSVSDFPFCKTVGTCLCAARETWFNRLQRSVELGWELVVIVTVIRCQREFLGLIIMKNIQWALCDTNFNWS